MDQILKITNSFQIELNGATSVITDIPVGSKIIYINILQSGVASNSWVECGSTLFRNYARDTQTYLSFTSTTTCNVVKTGNDNAFFNIVYLPPNATSTNNDQELSGDGIMMTYAFGIFMMIMMFNFFKGLFKVDRYE
jgi:hypothetical protein